MHKFIATAALLLTSGTAAHAAAPSASTLTDICCAVLAACCELALGCCG